MRHLGAARSERVVSRLAAGRLHPALVLSFALVAGLALCGCSDPAAPAEVRPPIGSSVPQEGSGTVATDPGSARSKPSTSRPDSTAVDPQSAASIESSVSDAESLLHALNQEFQQDATETS
jgi:hypothetical protein